jgi:hypothetical protein
MNPMWLIRLAQWARNPPSPERVKLVLAVIAVCLLIFGYEALFGWPDWFVPQKVKP